MSEPAKKFSIITSAHNSSKFLLDWAQSILKQTYRPLEVILVNDSQVDDGTIRLVKELIPTFAKHGISFRFLKNKRQLWCASSYEKARQAATGYYIGVLDSDDMLKGGAVQYVVDLYERYPEVTYIYTQFAIYNMRMKRIKVGMSRHPGKYDNLLEMGKAHIHGFSHWRTFSDRFPRPDKLFKPKLRCAVDKYMGYRLEEHGIGMFADHICYRYRQRWSKSISTSEPTKKTWKRIIKEAEERRQKYNLNIYPILLHRD